MIRTWISVLSVFILLKFQATEASEDAFSLLFETNKDSFVDRPIQFENPLPRWLRGSLVRTGPGQFGNGPRNFSHVFDGFAKFYNWKFYGNGSASFSTNFIHSFVYNNSMNEHNIDNYLTFKKPTPPFDFVHEQQAILKGMDNMNINVYRLFNKDKSRYEYVTLSDAWKLYEIDPVNMKTIAPIDAEKPTGSNGFISLMSSAHPVPEFGTGNTFTFLTSVSVVPGIPSHLTVVRLKSSTDREMVAQWNVDRAPYMHSLSSSENYVILFAAPYYVSPPKMLENCDAFSGLEWLPTENSHFYVVEVKTGRVKTFATSIINPNHHVNAYEDGNKLIIDVTVSKDPFFANIFDIDAIRDQQKRDSLPFKNFLKRYTIDMESDILTETPISFNPKFSFINNFDTPAINENFRHKQYCFAYGAAIKKDLKRFSTIALVKRDVCGQNRDNAWYTAGQYPLEMWFVATPNATREDDGVLLSPVLDGDKRQSYLLMLNATTMLEMNRAYLNTIVPFTIHGRFFDDLV